MLPTRFTLLLRDFGSANMQEPAAVIAGVSDGVVTLACERPTHYHARIHTFHVPSLNALNVDMASVPCLLDCRICYFG